MLMAAFLQLNLWQHQESEHATVHLDQNLVEGCCSLHADSVESGSDQLHSDCAALTLARLQGYSMALAPRKFWRDHAAMDSLIDVGARCTSNRTLKFVALDSRHYSWLGAKIGARAVVTNRSSSYFSAWRSVRFAIVDKLNEHVYVPDSNGADVAPESVLTKFIKDFSTGQPLSRALVTSTSLWKNRRTKSKRRRPSVGRRQIQLKQATGANFQSMLAEKQHDILVFYTGGAQCLACMTALHLLHTFAVVFADMRHILDIVVLDVSANDLPWRYTVDRVPAIIFFPANRRSESTAFPMDSVPLTVPNMVAFTLAAAGRPKLRWHAALANCDWECLRANERRITERVWNCSLNRFVLSPAQFRALNNLPFDIALSELKHRRRIDSALLRSAHFAGAHTADKLRRHTLRALRKNRISQQILTRLKSVLSTAGGTESMANFIQDALFLDWLRRVANVEY